MTKKSKLLVQGDYPLIASPTLAVKYGVPSAMFLQKLHYCLQSSDAKFIQQQKYFYHSYEQWADTLGIYSVSTIKRIVSKLKKAGVIIVKKLAQNKWLQTNFYTINYRKLSTFIKGITEQNAPKMKSSIQANESKQPHTSSALSIATSSVSKLRASNPTPIGLTYPLSPVAQISNLQAMSSEKRGLYRQLLQMKVDIHYDDARLDEWLKRKKFIVQKVAYLKDQLGHLKMHWHSPEQLGLKL